MQSADQNDFVHKVVLPYGVRISRSPGFCAPGRAVSFLRVASHGELTGREQNPRAASREFAGEFAGRACRPAQRVASPEDRADLPGAKFFLVPGTFHRRYGGPGFFITTLSIPPT